MDNILVTLVAMAGCGAITLAAVFVGVALTAAILRKIIASDDELTAEAIYRVMITKDGIEP